MTDSTAKPTASLPEPSRLLSNASIVDTPTPTTTSMISSRTNATTVDNVDDDHHRDVAEDADGATTTNMLNRLEIQETGDGRKETMRTVEKAKDADRKKNQEESSEEEDDEVVSKETEEGGGRPAFEVEDAWKLEKMTVEDETFRWVGTQGQKLVYIKNLGKIAERNRLKVLNLRSNLIKSLKGVETVTTLETLEMYDNRVKKMKYVDKLVNLTILDLSYNRLKRIRELSTLTRLKKLYLASNRISNVPAGALDALGPTLEMIDLGANRLRKIEGLSKLTNLKELWLGKNKIVKIEGIETLHNLIRLDVQSNRLTDVQSIPKLPRLQELYLSHNGITSMNGIEHLTSLNTLDMSSNKISRITSVHNMVNLEEFWMNSNPIEDFEEVEKFAKENHPKLKTIYLQHCPIAKTVYTYRKQIVALFPTLTQLDADPIRRPR